jgi:hypothetical protein
VEDPVDPLTVDLLRVEIEAEPFAHLSFPKIPSARIRALRQNQSIILGDACMPSAAFGVPTTAATGMFNAASRLSAARADEL